MKGKQQILSGVTLLCFFLGCSDHNVHRASALRDIVMEGAGIGIVVDEVKTNRPLPITGESFLNVYRSAFRISRMIRTNELDLLELSLNGVPLWTIDRRTGAVRLVGTADPKNSPLVRAFESVDFSKPMSAENAPTLNPTTSARVKAHFDEVRRYYVQTRD